MGRTRDAALAGAVRSVAKYGARKSTMGDIAMLAGIAKATLYNHFRTKPEVYAATVATEVDAIAAAAGARLGDGLEAALAEAARLVGEHPAVRKIASGEPETLGCFPEAATYLGYMFQMGLGVPRNRDMARMWFDVAAAWDDADTAEPAAEPTDTVLDAVAIEPWPMATEFVAPACTVAPWPMAVELAAAVLLFWPSATDCVPPALAPSPMAVLPAAPTLALLP